MNTYIYSNINYKTLVCSTPSSRLTLISIKWYIMYKYSIVRCMSTINFIHNILYLIPYIDLWNNSEFHTDEILSRSPIGKHAQHSGYRRLLTIQSRRYVVFSSLVSQLPSPVTSLDYNCSTYFLFYLNWSEFLYIYS